MEKRIKTRWLFYISIAAIMFSTYIGPSVTAGTLVVSFFLTKGWAGVVLGPLVCAVVAGLIDYAFFTYSRYYSPQHYRERTELIFSPFGKVVCKTMGVIYDIIVIVSVLVVVSTMVSTEASLLHTTFGLNTTFTAVVFAVILCLLCTYGLLGIQKISTACTAVLVAILIVVAAVALPKTFDGAMGYLGQLEPITAHGFTVPGAWFVMISYCNNYQGAIDTAAPMYAAIKTKKEAVILTVVSVVPCWLITQILTFAYSSMMPEVLSMEIPCFALLERCFGTSTIVSVVYVVFMTLAIVTTCVGMLYALTYRFVESLQKVRVFRCVDKRMLRLGFNMLVMLVAVLGSMLGVMNLVYYGYSMMAQATLPIFILSALGVVYRVSRDKKRGILPDTALKQVSEGEELGYG